jgi:hypothetical protein
LEAQQFGTDKGGGRGGLQENEKDEMRGGRAGGGEAVDGSI